MTSHDPAGEADLTFEALTHNGVVVATGPAAAEHVIAAVRAYGENCPDAGGGGVTVEDRRALRWATLKDPDVIGYTGILDEATLEGLVAAAMSGTRVYVATTLSFVDVRDHLLAQATRWCDGHDSGLVVVPYG